MGGRRCSGRIQTTCSKGGSHMRHIDAEDAFIRKVHQLCLIIILKQHKLQPNQQLSIVCFSQAKTKQRKPGQTKAGASPDIPDDPAAFGVQPPSLSQLWCVRLVRYVMRLPRMKLPWGISMIVDLTSELELYLNEGENRLVIRSLANKKKRTDAWHHIP